jgi:hypothetical protein
MYYIGNVPNAPKVPNGPNVSGRRANLNSSWERMGKRGFLFLATNIAIVVTLSIVLRLLGVGRYVTPYGTRLPVARHLLARLGHGRRVPLAADVALDSQAGHRRAAR